MVYLDNAATTLICEPARRAIIDNIDSFYNPSSSYESARKVRIKIEEAREKIAILINAEPDEIYFTSGGSEANTWAMRKRVSIASNIEHSSLDPDMTFNVSSSGLVNAQNFEERIKRINSKFQLDIASTMMINNEIGTIQPIKELCEIAHNNGMLFHTDAVQAVGHIPIDVKYLDIDMLSASGHKFFAPKGVGFLYVKDKIKMPRLIRGGSQEKGIRGGTENTIGILAMAEALEYSVNHMNEYYNRISHLSGILKNRLLSIDGVYLNGIDTIETRYCGNLNFRIDGIKASDFVTMADRFGICISAGSACHEGDAQPSHVLTAIGLTNEQALSSIRITFAPQNTEQDINYCCEMFPKIIKRLREIRS